MSRARLPVLKFRRGAAILPSLFTTGNLFFGFWTIIKAIHGQYEQATVLIALAVVLDALDGRIARLTGTASEFGGELDSLADVISFGVAPAVLAYQWGFFETVPRAGWLGAFLFVMCGTLRLARFNVQRHSVDGRFFVGLPIPAAAGQVAALIHFHPAPLGLKGHAVLALAMTICLAFLMVSTLRYPSFKGFDLRVRRSYITILPIGVAIAVLFLSPEYSFLGLMTLYSLWAPIAYVLGLVVRRRPSNPPGAVVVTGAAQSG